MNTKKRL